MRFLDAIDDYLRDQRAYGRVNSDRTEVAYRSRLVAHAEDVANRDPRTVGREDVKRTLRRWGHPNTQRHAHAVLTSFYDWAMEEGHRKDNPARQIRKAKKRPTTVYRLTRREVLALMDACVTRRERATIYFGALAGLRNQELRGLRGRHLARVGWVHVSEDIAKGRRERWVPVLSELVEVVDEVVAHVALDEFVIPSRRPANPPLNTEWRENPWAPASAQAIWRIVDDVADRAKIHAHVHPHLLRHAYGDHVAKYAGLRAAQALLGHVSVDTTAGTYVDRPSLDELAVSVQGFSYRGYPPAEHLGSLEEATTGIEPVTPSNDVATGDSGDGDPDLDPREGQA